MFHPKIIFRIIGFLLMIEAAFLSSSLAVSLYYGEHILMSYIYTLAAIVGCGTLFACIGKGSSPISSRNSVPLFASSKRPMRVLSEPVNAPFS